MSSALGFSASKARRPSAIHESITQTICNTPIVKLGKLSPPGVNVFCKLEAANPGGSVKVASHPRREKELKIGLESSATYRP